jgi:hypothetical protein
MQDPVEPGSGTTHKCQSILECELWSGPLREGHYGQRSCVPQQQVEHMAAPTSLAETFNKTLANGGPSTHGTPWTKALGPLQRGKADVHREVGR